MMTFSKTLIIAEAGVNHNGDINHAVKMIEVAAKAGADIVKFQSFNASKLVSKFAPKAEYQKKKTDSHESQLEMLKKLELSKQDHLILLNACHQNHIEFLSSPFDLQSLEFLTTIGIKRIKIPSGEITHLPLLRAISKKNLPVILSTGMSEVQEIQDAVNILKSSSCPLTLLHCNTDYPTPMQDVHLNAMQSLKQQFKLPIGYSDHTDGIEISLAAVALGATVIEKHFTLDRKQPGPDHQASLEPHELKSLVTGIRNIEVALGLPEKKPSPSELKNRPIARKSIVAASDIKKNELFTDLNLIAKRPGTGISPMEWDKVIGSRAKRDFQSDELIEV